MSDELKRCPFCGGEAELQSSTGDPWGEDRVSWRAVCKRPMCQGGACNVWEITPKDAIGKWNTRAAVADGQFALAIHDGEVWQRVRECRNVGEETGDDFKCSLCGASYNESDDMAMPASLVDWCFSCGAKVAPC